MEKTKKTDIPVYVSQNLIITETATHYIETRICTFSSVWKAWLVRVKITAKIAQRYKFFKIMKFKRR